MLVPSIILNLSMRFKQLLGLTGTSSALQHSGSATSELGVLLPHSQVQGDDTIYGASDRSEPRELQLMSELGWAARKKVFGCHRSLR